MRLSMCYVLRTFNSIEKGTPRENLDEEGNVKKIYKKTIANSAIC